MAGIAKKSFEYPGRAVGRPDKTQVEVVDLGSVKAARMTLQPGLAVVGVHQASGRDRQLSGASCRHLWVPETRPVR